MRPRPPSPPNLLPQQALRNRKVVFWTIVGLAAATIAVLANQPPKSTRRNAPRHQSSGAKPISRQWTPSLARVPYPTRRTRSSVDIIGAKLMRISSRSNHRPRGI
jgi:hypothetical protein